MKYEIAVSEYQENIILFIALFPGMNEPHGIGALFAGPHLPV
jgi:hypothetical protein